jgi:hypothetical protein
MWLNDCAPEEQTVLMAIATLAASLKNPLVDYAGALQDLNRKYFGKPTPRRPEDLNPMPRSMTQSRRVAASPRYGS